MTYAKHVLIMNQVWDAAAKAPFVPSGVSVLGAIEYDKERDLVRCHECGEWLARIGGRHLKKHALASTQEYKVRHGLRAGTSLMNLALKRKLADNANLHLAGVRPGGGKRVRTKQFRSDSAGDMEKRNLYGRCQAQLVAKLQQLAAELDRTPNSIEMHQHGIFHQRISVRALRVAAGLSPLKSGRKKGSSPYSADVLRELLRDFYVTNQRLPGHSDWGKGMLPGAKAYVRRFGTLSAAYTVAGLALADRERKRARVRFAQLGKTRAQTQAA